MKEQNKVITDQKKIITSSWQRCDQFGLKHDSQAEYPELGIGEIEDLKNEHQFLLGATGHEVLPYYENILANSNCLVMLADQKGQVLNCWGDQRFINKNRKHHLREGANWSEPINGTNAIGTAIATGQAVQVQRDEHYLKANRFMIGSAAPIYNTDNELLAVLDVSSDAYLPQAHTLGMVKMMSQSVENRLIYSKFSTDQFLMTFNTNTDNLDSQWVGLIVFDEAGTIISANRRAEMLLRYELALKNVEDVFGCHLFELKNQPEGMPSAVVALGKYKMYALVQRPTKGYIIAPDYRKNAPAVDTVSCLPRIQVSHGDAKTDRCLKMAKAVFEKDVPILLQGDTGVGKGVFAKELHANGPRKDHPFITINCTELRENSFELELFGSDQEDNGSIGLIRRAHKGVLFLDEISEIPLALQSKFLRVLEERKVHPVEAKQAYPVDIRILSASNENLKQRVADGLFRNDLYFRISGLKLELPLFRDRADKAELIRSIHQTEKEPEQPDSLSDEVVELLASHPWPGNLRQLKNTLSIALVMADEDPIEPWHLPDDFFADLEPGSISEPNTATSLGTGSTHPISTSAAPGTSSITQATTQVATPRLEAYSQAQLNEETLREYNQNKGNISRTAKALGISRNTLYKRLKEIGIKQ